MKHLVQTLSYLILACSHSFAGFEIPRHVKKISELADVQAKASNKAKGISFVYTDPSTT
jgi:hypothetical protein